MWFFSKKPVKMSTEEVNRIAAEIEKKFLETQRRKEQERLEKEKLERERQERARLEQERRERERKEREEREKQQRAEKGEEAVEWNSSVRYSIDSPSYSLAWSSPDLAYEEITTRFVKKTGPTFVDQVTRIMAKKGLMNKDIYSAVQMDRKLFSKVMSDRNYKPAKDTCVAILMALKVDKDEAISMLKSAGYALSDSNIRDTVFDYFFSHAHYNIFDMNDVLYQLNEKPLGECRF